MPGTPSGAEPHLRLAEGLRTVVDVQRQVGAGADQAFQRHPVPAEGLCVHHGLGALLDDPGDADTDTEHVTGGHPGPSGHRVDAGQHVPGHHGGLGACRVERILDAAQQRHREVEQLDPDPGLTHVHPDHEGEPGCDAQQHAGPATVGLGRAGLGDQALVDQVGHHVAHRRLTQPGAAHQVLPGERTVEEELGQQGGPVAQPHAAVGGSHQLHSSPRSRRSSERL
ncbi:hypothetical protein GCM10027614_06540 [Micromonospora vulcania]